MDCLSAEDLKEERKETSLRRVSHSVSYSLVKDHGEKRTANLKTAIVVNEPELPEFVHERTDPWSRRSHHFRQSFLADLGNFGPLFYAVVAETGEQ